MLYAKSLFICAIAAIASVTFGRAEVMHRPHAHAVASHHDAAHEKAVVPVEDRKKAHHTLNHPAIRYTGVDVTGFHENVVHVQIYAEYSVVNGTNATDYPVFDNSTTHNNLLSDNATTFNPLDTTKEAFNIKLSSPVISTVNGEEIARFIINLDYHVDENESAIINGTDNLLNDTGSQSFDYTHAPVDITEPVSLVPTTTSGPDDIEPATSATEVLRLQASQGASSTSNGTFVLAMAVVACVALACGIVAVVLSVRVMRNRGSTRSVLGETTTEAEVEATVAEEASENNSADEEIDMQATENSTRATTEDCAV